MTNRRLAVIVLCVFAWIGFVREAAAQGPAQEKDNRPEFEISPGGYIQLDWRGYPSWDVTPGTGRLQFDTFEVRRLRAGVDGRWKRLSFEFTIDPQDVDDGATLVKDAYAEFRLRNYRLRAGQFKPPGSREYGASARNLDFLERAALAQSLAAQRDIGAMVHGRLRRPLDYEVGVFAGDNNGSGNRSGLMAVGRV
jgi:phosphate-selective porin